MALTNDDIQAIGELLKPIKEQQDAMKEQQDVMKEQQDAMKEQQAMHTRSIMTLENKVMHELKLLNENLPDVITRNEELKELRETVDDHGNRIFALEQVANK